MYKFTFLDFGERKKKMLINTPAALRFFAWKINDTPGMKLFAFLRESLPSVQCAGEEIASDVTGGSYSIRSNSLGHERHADEIADAISWCAYCIVRRACYVYQRRIFSVRSMYERFNSTAVYLSQNSTSLWIVYYNHLGGRMSRRSYISLLLYTLKIQSCSET